MNRSMILPSKDRIFFVWESSRYWRIFQIFDPFLPCKTHPTKKTSEQELFDAKKRWVIFILTVESHCFMILGPFFRPKNRFLPWKKGTLVGLGLYKGWNTIQLHRDYWNTVVSFLFVAQVVFLVDGFVLGSPKCSIGVWNICLASVKHGHMKKGEMYVKLFPTPFCAFGLKMAGSWYWNERNCNLWLQW